MERIVVVFGSITSATGVRKQLLNKYNIESKIVQTPKNLSLNGCSYCLVTSYSALKKVVNIAKDNGVSIKGMYREDGTRIKTE